MRVIGGTYKSRKLKAPQNGGRPTLDRTKETLFNILQFKISGARVLDLFAGSGQIGIECLSRGAKEAVFCDGSAYAAAAIKENLASLSLTAQVLTRDYAECLNMQKEAFDFIFIDPPYGSELYVKVLEKLSSFKLLSAGGTAVCEHSNKTSLPQKVGDLIKTDDRKVGTVRFSFYTISEDCK